MSDRGSREASGGGRLTEAWVCLGVVGVHALMVFGSACLLSVDGLALPFLPAAGVALACALELGTVGLVGVLLGTFAGALLGQQAIDLAAAAAIGAVGQAWLGATLLRWSGTARDLLDQRDIVRFLLLGGVVAGLVGAGAGAWALPPHMRSWEATVTAWLGAAAGVFLLAPVATALLRRRTAAWTDRVIPAAASLVVGALLLGVGLHAVVGLDGRAAVEAQGRLAAVERGALTADLEHAAQAVRGLADALAVWDGMPDQATFRSLTRAPLEANAVLAALSWNPWLSHADRPPALTERDAAGQLVSAAARPWYVPVSLIEPHEPNRWAIGFDVASEPLRRAALERARRTGQPALSAPLDLVQASDSGVLLFARVGGAQDPRGFVVGVFRPARLLARTVTADGQLRARLLDVTDADESLLGVAGPGDGGFQAAVSSPIEIAGREWRLELAPAAPRPALFARARGVGIAALAALLVGLLSALTLLMSARRHLERGRLGRLTDLNQALQDEVAQRQQAIRDAEHLASHDPLTGLPNRRAFERRLQGIVARAHAGQGEHAVAFVDLDQFKVVNDTVGHVAGDELLKQVSGLLLGAIRAGDTLARLGGDEFGLLLPDSPLAQSEVIAERLVSSLSGHRFLWADQPFVIGASVGLVGVGADAPSTAEIIARADAACYSAKLAGRGRVAVHRHDVGGRHPASEALSASQLQEVFSTGALRLVRQQIVPLGGQQEAHGWELFVRMVGPGGSLVPPATFLPSAERFGLMPQLDRWVIAHGIEAVAGWPAGERAAINLSGLSMGDPGLPEFIGAHLERAQLAPERISFEIPETAALRNLAAATTFIAAVRALGCRFALDDVGTGLSAFGYLKGLPLDYLKIDGSFVRDLADPTQSILVRAIHDLAGALGVATIAECTESPEAVVALRALGVQYAQGWAFGRPEALPGEAALEA